ncbi:unnamed protein product [Anisakis simplex]|uniref:MFS domain-containing protein n=1 Tax=Anisakis simplex TaxID=6269 RepID=A0A0M3JW49_ANISI|nr:unnamed protein product [Anisakis simplex]
MNLQISKEQIARLVAVEMSKRNEQHNAKGEKRFSYIDLYSSRKLLTYTIVTSFSLFVINCVTYSLVFNMSQVQGSIYVNTAISGILRYCIGIAIAVVDYIYVNAGRKLVHIVSMAVIDMCLGGVLVLLHFGTISSRLNHHYSQPYICSQFDPSNQTANNILGLAERFNYLIRIFTLTTFGITGSIFAQVLLISAELFPTVVRNLANAHSNVVARVGTTLAPLIFQLVSHSNDNFSRISILSQSAPYLLLITLSTIDIFAILFAIPETKNTHLAHFISDELNG